MGQYNFKMERGLFIVIEGLDRCGKSTQTKRLIEEIGNKNCVEMCFPDRKTEIGKLINTLLTSKLDDIKMNDQATHLLFSANRWEKNSEIQNVLLNEKKDIVCSRYYFSGAAYSMAKGLGYQWCVSPEDGLVVPDIIFYLKHASSKDLSKREGFGLELFEDIDFQEKVSICFDTLFRLENVMWDKKKDQFRITDKDVCYDIPHYVEIDASKDIDDIAMIIMNAYKKIKSLK
jgi:dTMP kinase